MVEIVKCKSDINKINASRISKFATKFKFLKREKIKKDKDELNNLFDYLKKECKDIESFIIKERNLQTI